jgi:hypothetical protein
MSGSILSNVNEKRNAVRFEGAWKHFRLSYDVKYANIQVSTTSHLKMYLHENLPQ